MLALAYRGRADPIVGDRLLVTPHAAWSSPESVSDARRLAVETAMLYLREGRLRNLVNVPLRFPARPETRSSWLRDRRQRAAPASISSSWAPARPAARWANRLSASGRHSVLLLEAGGNDNWIWFHVPVGYLYAMGNPRADWCYRTEPEAGLNGRSLAIRAAGSSAARRPSTA